MKRSVRVMGLGVLLTLLLSAGIFFAQPAHESLAAARLPDLTIDKIYLTKDCMVAVVVKNLGPGIVPDEVWTVHTPKSAGVYLYKNGTGWGGASIWLFDPAKNLQKPGGIATYASTLKVTGTEAIKAVVDLWNVVLEANEGNNSLEMKLSCDMQTGPCCIAGDYDGTYSAACPLGIDPPAFYMYIIQANCGSKIEGRLEACNDVYQLSGIVTRADKCCKVVGELRGIPGNPTEGKIARIEFIVCKDARGKWYTNNGVYRIIAGRDCSGTFTMKQR